MYVLDPQPDVTAAHAVAFLTQKRRSPPAVVERVVRDRALAGPLRRRFQLVIGCAQIAQCDDVVHATFAHADAAAPIGLASTGGFHRVVRAECVQLAARKGCRLAAALAPRVERRARKCGSIHRPKSSRRTRSFPSKPRDLNSNLTGRV